MPENRPTLKERIQDASERFGEWLDEAFPQPPPELVPVPVPVRNRPSPPRRHQRR